jgi:hypothetical protein
MTTASPLARLQPVRCAECSYPVCHVDPRVAGTLAGGVCTHCRKDKNGLPKRVYTYMRYVDQESGSD